MVVLRWGPVRFQRPFEGSVTKTSGQAGGMCGTRSGSALRPLLCAPRWTGSLAGLQKVWGRHGHARADLGIHWGGDAEWVAGFGGLGFRTECQARLALLEVACSCETVSACRGRSRW